MKNILQYNSPAPSWEKGMALGNGRLGAMLLGECSEEKISLNEDTLWSGYPLAYDDESVQKYLPMVQELIFQKKYTEAEQLINQHMVGIWNESYLPMADLHLHIPELATGVQRYERSMNLGEGICQVRLEKEGRCYTREAFCSYPDQVLAIRLRCSEGFQDNMQIRLSSQLRNQVSLKKAEIWLEGYCPSIVEPDYYPAANPVIYDKYEETRAIKFAVSLKVVTDGEVICKEDCLEVSKGKEVLILLTAGNSFIDFRQKPSGEYQQKIEQILTNAKSRSYEELRKAHIDDFTALFNRVELDLGHTENENLPMEERQQKMFEGDRDPELIATAFQFGRYLLISSSRAGTQPANLQGIWNDKLRAPWSANYTVNINTQMNYWPAQICNLPECEEPLVDFIRDIAETGKRTAASNYGCRGWVVHHNVDLWRKTTAVGSRNKEVDVLPWSFWTAGGGWFCQHLWERYQFSKDKIYLEKTAYPLMKECARFYLDFLVEYNGELVINPSTSPENLFVDNGEAHGITYGCTLDNAVLTELFGNCIEAAAILGGEEEIFIEELREALGKIPGFKVGKHGQLQEWYEDFDEKDPEHRHLSLLYGLYPGNLITVEETPELAEACKVTMKRRGEGSVPWSRAWKVGIQARLKNGEKAYEEVKRFLQPADSNEISYDDGGIYQNLFCARPLEVDGNFGFTAGVAEMLVQSHMAEAEFLPAIPKAWSDGYVRGLRIRGNKEVELRWKDSKIEYINITESKR